MCDNCDDHIEGGSIINIIEPSLPFCQDCGDDQTCTEKLDSACVVYHLDHPEKPTKLTNLGLPNGATAEQIFEAIDDQIGGGLNIPLTTIDTDSVDLTATGPAHHILKADVKISSGEGNTIIIKSDGLFSTGGGDDGKVKVDSADSLDYLQDQVQGGTDGIVSLDIHNQSGLLAFLPSLDIAKLILALAANPDFVNLICRLSEVCQETCPTISDINATTA